MDKQSERQDEIKALLHYFFQDNTRSGSHCKYNLKYHIVWIPKYRRKLLIGELAKRLEEILFEIAREYKFKIIALDIMPDHVHMLVEIPPKYSPSKAVQIFKGISSRRMREEFLETIKQYIWKKGTLWATGYYISSIGDNITTEIVREYIENQKISEESQKDKLPTNNISEQLALFEN